MGMSDYLEAALLNATFRNVAFTSPVTVYAALFLTDPTDAGTGTEVSTAGTAYARQAATFAAPGATNGQIQTSADITYPTATAAWGAVAFAAIYDAAAGGNLLAFGPMTSNKTVDIDDIFKFLAGNLKVTFA